MGFWWRLSVAARLKALSAVFAVAMLLTAALSWATLERMKVNGPIYAGIVAGKDLVADVLPPPEYIIEAHLTAHQLASTTDPAGVRSGLDRLAALHSEYESRHGYWDQALTDPALRQAMLVDAYEPAVAYFRGVDTGLAPAVRRGDSAEAQRVVRADLEPLYQQHRRAIDQTVRLVNAANAAAEQGAADEVAQRTALLLLAAAVATLATVALSRSIGRGVSGPLQATAARAHRLAQGDLSVHGDAYQRADEVGQLHAAFGQMQQAVAHLVSESDRLAAAAGAGQLGVRAQSHGLHGDYRRVLQGFNQALAAIAAPIAEAATVLARVAENDLTARVQGDYAGAYGDIKTALNTAVARLDGALGRIHLSAEQVALVAARISSSAQQQANGAATQAATLHEVTTTLHQMSARAGECMDVLHTVQVQADQSAAVAQDLGSLTGQNRAAVARSLQSVAALTEAMDGIRTTSHATADVLRTMDEISFETQLLAINAGVEASHAGAAGRAFGVIAEEVRTLAARASVAAREMNALVERSSRSVEQGLHATADVRQELTATVAVNQQVLADLEVIGGQVTATAELVGKVAGGARGLQAGIAGVAEAADDLDRLTQQNAVSAEESAAAAAELAESARETLASVDAFKRTDAPAAPVPATPSPGWRLPHGDRHVLTLLN